MSRLLKLTDKVYLGDREYSINTDFRVWIEIERLMLDNEAEPGARLAKILALAYPVLPENPHMAVQGILWFYSGCEDDCDRAAEEGHSAPPCYDLTEDFDYIWGGFMWQYRIDLTEERLHWWKFKALLLCLDDNCRFSRIVAFRSMDTSKLRDKEQRRYCEKMKKRYRLKGSRCPADEARVADSLEGLF